MPILSNSAGRKKLLALKVKIELPRNCTKAIVA
jgi:hypothetical protein